MSESPMPRLGSLWNAPSAPSLSNLRYYENVIVGGYRIAYISLDAPWSC